MGGGVQHSNQSWMMGIGGWTNTHENLVRVFEAPRSTEGRADFLVDRRALREVASSLFRVLTTQKSAH
jgi:hypothetical protein